MAVLKRRISFPLFYHKDPVIESIWQYTSPRRLSENGYFSQSPRQAEIIILEILHCMSVVIISAFLDLEKNISFSDSLLAALF
jgi:hypothetical protein